MRFHSCTEGPSGPLDGLLAFFARCALIDAERAQKGAAAQLLSCSVAGGTYWNVESEPKLTRRVDSLNRHGAVQHHRRESTYFRHTRCTDGLLAHDSATFAIKPEKHNIY